MGIRRQKNAIGIISVLEKMSKEDFLKMNGKVDHSPLLQIYAVNAPMDSDVVK